MKSVKWESMDSMPIPDEFIMFIEGDNQWHYGHYELDRTFFCRPSGRYYSDIDVKRWAYLNLEN